MTDADVIIDVATLTAAQNVALGDEVGAMFVSNDESRGATRQGQ
jgi:leucyl aminopeptidase